MDNECREMYLKVIYEFEEEGKSARITAISKELKVAPASVTEMLDKLAKQGLVVHEHYGSVSLTPKGNHIASLIIRKFRLINTFLTRELGMSDSKKDACRMEHAMSDLAANKLCLLLKCPKADPHGKIIPSCEYRGCSKNCAYCRHSKAALPPSTRGMLLSILAIAAAGELGKLLGNFGPMFAAM